MAARQHSRISTLRAAFAAAASFLAMAWLPAPATGAEFAMNFGEPGAGTGVIAAVGDAAGNTFVAGTFNAETLDVGAVALSRIGTMDLFVAKLDAAGATVWARNFGGTGASMSAAPLHGLALDGDGNLVVGGRFQGGDLQSPELPIAGTADTYLMKLAPNGTTVWARGFGGSGAKANAFGVAVGADGAAYLHGDFTGASLSFPPLTRTGLYDAFTVKLDGNGFLIWARNFGGAGASARGGGVTVDGDGNVFVAGGMGDGSLTTPALTRIGIFDAYVIKLDAEGNIAWAHNFGGPGASLSSGAIANDGLGNLYIAGQIDADITTPAITRIGVRDLFAIKLDSSGAVTWTRNFGGAGTTASGGRLAVDADGNVFLAGAANGVLTTPSLAMIGTIDPVLLRLHPAGTTTLARRFGGSGSQANPQDVSVGSGGKVLLGGNYYLAGLTTPPLALVGTSDGFVLGVDVAPAATTGTASSVTAATASLAGTVDDQGFAVTTIRFDYGETDAYGGTQAATPSSLAAGSGSTGVAGDIAGLACGTPYHFRVSAVHAAGTSRGNDATFTTAACASGKARPDFDADGRGDLPWQHADGRVAVWLMNGLAPAATAEILPAGTGFMVSHLADFDGDGRSDLFFEHGDGRAAIWLMNGAAPSAMAQVLDAGSGWTAAHTPDLDGDGKADIVWRHGDGTHAAWLMDGIAVSGGASILAAGTDWGATHAGDFDGDGKADLVWTHLDGRAAIWLMNGLVPAATQQILNAGSGWSVAHAADLDGDGKADIVWENADGSVAVWLMNGAAMGSGASIMGPGSGWSVAKAADFDGDGKADLYWQHEDGRAAIWLMDGLAPTAATQILNAGSGWSIARAGDLDGDGKSDIVWENADGSVAVWLMDGAAMASGAGILGPASGWSVNGR